MVNCRVKVDMLKIYWKWKKLLQVQKATLIELKACFQYSNRRHFVWTPSQKQFFFDKIMTSLVLFIDIYKKYLLRAKFAIRWLNCPFFLKHSSVFLKWSLARSLQSSFFFQSSTADIDLLFVLVEAALGFLAETYLFEATKLFLKISVFRLLHLVCSMQHVWEIKILNELAEKLKLQYCSPKIIQISSFRVWYSHPVIFLTELVRESLCPFPSFQNNWNPKTCQKSCYIFKACTS